MSLTISLGGVIRRLTRLASEPLAPWLTKVALDERKKVETRIRKTKETPDHQPWAPWQPSTEARRKAKGTASRGLLYDEGLLLASVVSRSSPTTAGVSITVPYAPYLQDGTPHMVARAMLGWDDVSLAQHELEAIARLEKILQ